MLDALKIDPDRDVGSAGLHVGSIADLDVDRVQEHHRVERLQRAVLPGGDFVQDRVGDVGDGLVRQLHPQGPREVVLDLPDGHSAGVQRDDLVLQPAEPAGALRDELGGERALPIAGLIQLHRADLGGHGLARSAIAVVSVPATGVGIAAQMLGQLGAHAPLKDGLEHLVQKAVLASQLQPSRTGLGEYVINQRIREHLPAKPSSI